MAVAPGMEYCAVLAGKLDPDSKLDEAGTRVLTYGDNSQGQLGHCPSRNYITAFKDKIHKKDIRIVQAVPVGNRIYA
eukprot:scaffold11068_cov84-Amphora_coffeaeformis.AAC.1